MMPANPLATGVFSTSPVCGTFSYAYGTSFSCIRHVSCMIHVIKRGFLIGTRNDLHGGLSPIISKDASLLAHWFNVNRSQFGQNYK